MEYKDYFQRYIDQLGKVLAALLSEFSSSRNVSAGLRMENAQKVLKEAVDLDLQALLSIDNSSFISELAEYSIKPQNFEGLAELFLMFYDEEKNIVFLEKSLLLLKEVKENDSTYSLDRELKMKDIEQKILNT